MTSEFAWAPLVHGRTAFVDFRSDFIVSPAAFNSNQRSWAQRYVLAATRMADLRTRPLWCLFGDENFRVAGVVCNASDVSPDMNREEVSGRALYVFLGYVQCQPGRGLPRMDLENFAPLYSFVRGRWREKRHTSQRLVQAPFDLRPALATGEDPGDLDWNLSPNHLGLWPIGMKAELWQRAEGDSLRETSFCFGPKTSKLALDSPFRNVGAADVMKPALEKRPERAEPRVPRQDSENPPALPFATDSPARRAQIPLHRNAETGETSGLGTAVGVPVSSLPSGFRSKSNTSSKPHQDPPWTADADESSETTNQDLESPTPDPRDGRCVFWKIGLAIAGAAVTVYAIASSPFCRRSRND